MNTQSQSTLEPTGGPDLNPFGEPHTIPLGWEVSAFFTPELEALHLYGAQTRHSNPDPLLSSDYDNATDTL